MYRKLFHPSFSKKNSFIVYIVPSVGWRCSSYDLLRDDTELPLRSSNILINITKSGRVLNGLLLYPDQACGSIETHALKSSFMYV